MNPMQQSTIELYATEMQRVFETNTTVEALSECLDGFENGDAYRISAEVMRRRERAGWRRVGRKIGFTNRSIYEQYKVDQPMFGYMWDRTVSDAAAPGGVYTGEAPSLTYRLNDDDVKGTLSLAGLSQPLIEPEIVFGLRDTPKLGDPIEELLECIDWIGHGFEIVQCHFPGWRFSIGDCIADGGLHGRYIVGPRFEITRGNERSLVEKLAFFDIELSCNGEPVRTGGGRLVLGSPLEALNYLVQVLAELPEHPPLLPGEIITTGTLTDAMPVQPGQTWSTRIDGLPPLEGFELTLT
jgi:2-oxo-3-hexenedioate decarboxylase